MLMKGNIQRSNAILSELPSATFVIFTRHFSPHKSIERIYLHIERYIDSSVLLYSLHCCYQHFYTHPTRWTVTMSKRQLPLSSFFCSPSADETDRTAEMTDDDATQDATDDILPTVCAIRHSHFRKRTSGAVMLQIDILCKLFIFCSKSCKL